MTHNLAGEKVLHDGANVGHVSLQRKQDVYPGAILELHIRPAVIPGERRIGKHPGKLPICSVFQNHWVLQRVVVFDLETGDIVENQVHIADSPGGAIRILPREE